MIKIANSFISTNNSPFIIAELSANHSGSIEVAKNSILAAKNSGANAVKIQTYTPDTMTIDSNLKDFQIYDGLWKGKSLYELYSQAYTPYEWHQELFDYASEVGITIFSSPFDETAVDLLESLNTPAYKIASFELVDLPLIKIVAKTNKPLLMSTGMASLEEIGEALEVAKSAGNQNLLLFHCISSYPAPIEESNLNNILFLKKTFNVEVGLSDHTTSNIASIAAISLGASAIEKHFKLDDSIEGADSSFSLNANQFNFLVKECNEAWSALGKKSFSRANSEKENVKFRRSIYFVKDLEKGQRISDKDIKKIRPGYGLSPKYFDNLIGKKVTQDVIRGEAVTWEKVEN